MQVTGQGSPALPTSGISAVAVTFTVFNQSVAGILHADKDGVASPNTTVNYVDYLSSGQNSDTAVVAVGSDGAIQVELTSQADVQVDVQGYYTSGDTAAGGYVPVTPTGIASKTAMAAGATWTFQVSGLASVPSSASAVMLAVN
ncbi:MAG: hypothetical protein J0H43_15760, partial [Actinobacteria bacterium]|nr:hypothetical protein [Actinomycetota bacterium]